MATYGEVFRILEDLIAIEAPKTGPRSLYVENILIKTWNALRRKLSVPTRETTFEGYCKAGKIQISPEQTCREIPARTMDTIKKRLSAVGIPLDI